MCKNRRLIVSVIGNAASPQPEIDEMQKVKWELAFELGKTLVDHGCRVLSGGGRGIMRATFAGAHASKNYREGDTIAICPSYGFETANDFADIVIPTGADLARNVIVANSEVVIAIGGGAGTLNEISAAWKLGRLIIAYKNAGDWSEKLANVKLDDAPRYPEFDDKIWGVTNAEQAWEVIEKMLPKYNRVFDRIPYGVPKLKEKMQTNWVGPVIIPDDPSIIERIKD